MLPAPPHAILLWSDETHIYAELPCTDGTFHRLTFTLHERGLARALDLLKDHRPKPTDRPPATASKFQLKGYSPATCAVALALIKGARK